MQLSFVALTYRTPKSNDGVKLSIGAIVRGLRLDVCRATGVRLVSLPPFRAACSLRQERYAAPVVLPVSRSELLLARFRPR